MSDANEQSIRVTLLGTGAPTPLPDRFGAATLVEAGSRKLLFDAGRGATIRIRQLGIQVGDIDGVFITHFHSDHLAGLADLWLTGWLAANGRRDHPLAMWGPTGLKRITLGLEQAYSPDIEIRTRDEGLAVQGAAFDVTEFSAEGVVYEEEGIKVSAFAVNHGEHIKPAYGYRIDYGERSVVITGDTSFDESIIDAANGADLIIHEVIMAQEQLFEIHPELRKVQAHHTMPEEAGIIFSRVKPKLAVYTHLVRLSTDDVPQLPIRELVSQTRRSYSGPLIVGEDLMTFEVGKDIAVYKSG